MDHQHVNDPTYESLWRVPEVATFLGIPNSSVYRARKLHGLPTVKIGGTIRFKPASVRAWAAAREHVEQASPPDFKKAAVDVGGMVGGHHEPLKLLT